MQQYSQETRLRVSKDNSRPNEESLFNGSQFEGGAEENGLKERDSSGSAD